MAAGNCNAKFNWGLASPSLSEWEVAASQEDPLLSRSMRLYCSPRIKIILIRWGALFGQNPRMLQTAINVKED